MSIQVENLGELSVEPLNKKRFIVDLLLLNFETIFYEFFKVWLRYEWILILRKTPMKNEWIVSMN